MNYILRDYQKEAVEKGVEFFNSKNKKNVVEVLPTAAGKSLVVANIARQMDSPTLCLQPSKELLIQNYNKFVSYGNKASIYSASVGKKEIGEVTFATIGSIYKKPELFVDFKYIIIDECHLVSPREGSMHKSFFEDLNFKLLGLTATPFRLKSYNYPEPHSKLNMLNRMRPKIFQDFIYVTQIADMVERGYWSPLKYIESKFDKSNLILNSTGAAYTEQSIYQSIKNQNKINDAISWAKKLRKEGREQILIFAPSVLVSEFIAKKLGVNSVTSYTNKEDRGLYLQRFQERKDWAIVNVNVLSVGYDNQKIDAIIDLYPTLSLARYYQKLGRGVRIDLSENKTKEDCIIVDLVGNVELFGKIEDLEIDNIGGWGVFSKGKQLTNVELTKDNPIPELEDIEMNVGKHKGKKLKEIPNYYLKWVYDTWERNQYNESIFRYIEKNIL